MTKNVVLCTNTFDHTDNGPAKFAKLLVESNKNGNNIRYYILTEDITDSLPFVIKLKVRIPKILRPLGQFIRMFLYTKALIKLDKEYHFHKIIFNNSYQGVFTYLFGFRGKVIGMINDDNICDLKFSKDFLSKPNLYFYGKLERISVNLYDVILVNSNYLRQKLTILYAVDKSKFHILYKGIQANLMLRENITFDEPYIILFVKSDFKRGGLFQLIDALGSLSNKKFKIKVIGPKEPYFNLIRNYQKGYSNIELDLLGYKEQSEIFMELSKSHIFCVPSLKEALGVANIEAMNMCVSVISSNVGGIPEVLLDDSNGWMVTPNSPIELSVAIEECIENDELRNIKIKSAFNRSLDFNFENTVKRLNEIIIEC